MPRNYTECDCQEQFNFEKVELLCKDLPVNPCRAMVAGELCSPLSNHLKAKLVKAGDGVKIVN
jgi:hypothetical protein